MSALRYGYGPQRGRGSSRALVVTRCHCHCQYNLDAVSLPDPIMHVGAAARRRTPHGSPEPTRPVLKATDRAADEAPPIDSRCITRPEVSHWGMEIFRCWSAEWPPPKEQRMTAVKHQLPQP
jgi:hypothetical protein